MSLGEYNGGARRSAEDALLIAVHMRLCGFHPRYIVLLHRCSVLTCYDFFTMLFYSTISVFTVLCLYDS